MRQSYRLSPNARRQVNVGSPDCGRGPTAVGVSPEQAAVTQNVTQNSADLGSVTSRPDPLWRVLTPLTCANV